MEAEVKNFISRPVSSLRQIFILIQICILSFTVSTVSAQDFSGYQNYENMTAALKQMVRSHSNIAGMESIGKTNDGRDIWVITVAGPGSTPPEERPALFVGAAFEGDHLIGSEISLFITDFLLTNYESDETVRNSVTDFTYYILPRCNPDAAEKMFMDVKAGIKTNNTPFDGDNDGRLDEDGPEDLNKDGFITLMRVKSPDGKYVIDPKDARLVKKADPVKGERGVFEIFREGIDNDSDGFINEDPPGGVDLNRNFQHEYPYYQADAGLFMISETESRALMDWMLKHRNIAVVLTYGESDNLIVSPDSKGKLGPAGDIALFNFANEGLKEAGKVGIFEKKDPSVSRFMRRYRRQQPQEAGRGRPVRLAEKVVNKADISFYKTVGDKYKELTGIKELPPVRTPEGAFFQYGYYQFGVLSLSTPGWGITAPAVKGEEEKAGKAPAMPRKKSERSGTADSKFLKWMDSKGIDGFAEWTEFDHPELGKVEIGGFKPYALYNPPAEEISNLGKKNADFAIYLTTLFGKIEIDRTEVINHGGGLYQIKAEVVNTGYLPTSLRHGIVSRSVKPVMVQLGIDSQNIISGNNKTSFIRSLSGSGGREKFEWFVNGKDGDTIELKAVSQKAGSAVIKLSLK